MKEIEEIQKLPVMCEWHEDSPGPESYYSGSNHTVYFDPKNQYAVYIEDRFIEDDAFFKYEIKSDKGVFLIFVHETSSFGERGGHQIKMHVEVAGCDDKPVKKLCEATECMIAKIVQRINEDNTVDKKAIEKYLRDFFKLH